VLLAKKKISKEQNQGKNLDKKKKKIAKEKRRDRKGAHKEHSIALLFVVPFALSVFTLLSFIFVSLPCVSQLVLGTRIGQQLGQVL
jgi:hypothetical protein